jgi:hypothetical protein
MGSDAFLPLFGAAFPVSSLRPMTGSKHQKILLKTAIYTSIIPARKCPN